MTCPLWIWSPSETNISGEDEVYSEIETSIQEIESNTTDLVEKFTQPLFVLFNFFELDKAILSEIVNKYIAGEVTWLPQENPASIY